MPGAKFHAAPFYALDQDLCLLLLSQCNVCYNSILNELNPVSLLPSRLLIAVGLSGLSTGELAGNSGQNSSSSSSGSGERGSCSSEVLPVRPCIRRKNTDQPTFVFTFVIWSALRWHVIRQPCHYRYIRILHINKETKPLYMSPWIPGWGTKCLPFLEHV